jgi:hypothetical protein
LVVSYLVSEHCFYYQPYSIFDQNIKNEHNIMDLRHFVCTENVDYLNIWTHFIVCYSTQIYNLQWNLYIYNWSQKYQTKMHQHNLTSIIVHPTPSRFIKSTPTWFSNLCTQIWGFQRSNLIVLNWFEIEKWNFANAPMMRYISEQYFVYKCLIL